MFDQDDYQEHDAAYDLGRYLYTVLYAFVAGHFLTPHTLGQQIARLTAIPSMVLGLAAIGLLFWFPPSFALQGVACVGGLLWFCYTTWAAYVVEQAYVKDLEKAQHEEW
ncbi:hypothetical protein C5Y96_08045 [Blastopirellula marina]|uniref:Uncharacterized protein n=1 Tax=Blastopirellula marina TaxID=124 RepID=A0A2S8FYE1_9BACT|nr:MULTISPECIES: hypothetical protein [Pirellulaceae]PQO37100.1 hypothetical protein C5Y96_08045 [Blastopirellula marina]RCS53815.1 hypothetical protein DTL36_08055 [Bremerella cremea]